MDEVLVLEDGTMAPLDYKFAEYDDIVYSTYLTQVVMYGLMIEEIYGKVVNKGFIVYCRNGYMVKEIEITEKLKDEVKTILKEFITVTEGHFPKATRYKVRCIDCCYKNICIK